MFHTTKTTKGSMLRFAFLASVAMAMGLTTIKPAHALAPAGSTINNQASGVYSDGSGTNLNVTSNSVQTVVQPVAALILAANGNKNATIGSTVSFPHTITNTGNTTDVFNLTVADQGGDDFNITPIIRADANGDGVADGLLPITKTPSLAPGQSYQFVVTGVVLGTSGQSAIANVTATSQLDSGSTATNVDTVNVTTNAQVTVVKSIDKATGAPGSGPYTYTLTYTNAGNTAATDLTITDVLPLGLTYAPASGRWSTSGATALGDGVAGDPAGIDYTYVGAAHTLTAKVATVAAGASGKITFAVNVNAGILPQIIPNIALYGYNDGLTVLGNTPTNAVNLTITQLASFTFTGDTVTTANQGATVTFTNPLKNTGSGTDTFNITYGIGDFPLGTTFQLFQSDGVTPLTDTNGDGIPDTGPVDTTKTYNVVMKATLPPLSVGLGPWHQPLIGASTINALIINPAVDTLNGITASTVDLTNNAAGTLGAGAGPEATPVTILNGAAGTVQRFSLYVKNTGAIPDSYALLASANTTFAGLNLPAGFTLAFKDDNGGILTTTGVVAPGATVKVNADVFLPLGATPGQVNVYFRVLSALTGAVDTKLDAVNVTGLRSIQVGPNGSGQLYPGNAVVYTHTLTNTGNLPEGDGILSTIALSTNDSISGFTSVIYRDANGDGVLDATDPVVTNLNSNGIIAPGASVTLFVKVYAPAGADLGSINATTLTVTTTGGVGTVPVVTAKDSSTVIAGRLTMEKTQAIDVNGDGTPDVAYSVAKITTGAKPGACIRYRIIATNVGTSPATGFVINDATPAFTVYDNGDGTDGANGNAVWFDGTTFHAATSAPADGFAGTLKWTIGTLNPGQTATVTFGVRIQ